MDFDTIFKLSKEFALVWFFVIFVGVLIWAFWPGNRKRFEEAGRIPLEDERSDLERLEK